MAISTSAGTRVFIGPVVNISTIKAMTDEAALTFFEDIEDNDWTEVEEVESLGEFGDSTQPATFAALKDSRMTKLKTVRDAGTLAVVVGRDELDPGQMALVAAEKTKFNNAFKVVFADERDENYSPSTEYFGGMVLSRATTVGAVTDVTKRNFGVAINTAIYVDPTDPTGS